ncbi:MAG: SMC-Scp complex subunit ScpB [Candidatus Hadarchaeaceae archaeon]
MGIKQDRAIIEAALYAADRPLTLPEIKKLIGTSSETYVRKIIEDLKKDYYKRSGPLCMVETGKETYTLRLNEEFIPKLEGVIPKIRLTRSAIKTLAMIAYNQNISQAKLAESRGNRVYDQIRQLVSLGFIESRPFGRTRMLRTTKKFASYFGFEDDMDKIREEIQTRMR